MSQPVWNELVAVLHRPRLARFVNPGQRDAVLELLRSVCVWFEPQQRIRDCRDAKDNKFLELAVSGRASHILSGDSDLLTLHPFRGIPVVTPQVFLVSLQGEPHAED